MQKRMLKLLYWIVTILLVAFMFFGAIQELLQVEQAQKALTDLGYPVYVNYILGIAKIIGGLLLIQWKWRTIKEWAYAGFTIDIVGAAASVYFAGQSVGAALFTLVFLVPIFLSYWLWKLTSRKA